LPGKRFAAVNVQRLTGQRRVGQGEQDAYVKSSVVPIRLAGLGQGGICFRPLAAPIEPCQVIAWFHVAFREFLPFVLSGEFMHALYEGHGRLLISSRPHSRCCRK